MFANGFFKAHALEHAPMTVHTSAPVYESVPISKPNLDVTTSHGVRTIGDFHCQVRDDIFKRCSEAMCAFEAQNKQLLSQPYTPENMARLAAAEDRFIREKVTLGQPRSIGNFVARALPVGARTICVALVGIVHGAAHRGPYGAVDPSNPFQEQAKVHYYGAEL